MWFYDPTERHGGGRGFLPDNGLEKKTKQTNHHLRLNLTDQDMAFYYEVIFFIERRHVTV